jgi:DNA-binding Lrp family transcriptional regulator
VSVTAYVMVKAHTGDADRLREDIDALAGVETVDIVAGDMDLVTKVAVDDPSEVREIAATTLRNLDGVEDTQTYIAMN